MGGARLVHGLLSRAAQSDPDAVLIQDRRSLARYGEVDAASNRLARALRDQGVRKGHRVGLVCENSRDYVLAYYGILKTGAAVVSLNAQSDPGSLAGPLRDCTATGLVFGPRSARSVLAVRDVPSLGFALSLAAPPPAERCAAAEFRIVDGPGAMASADDSDGAHEAVIDLDPAAIVYTSGSTGRPRGAILRHLNLLSNTRSIVEYLGLSRDDAIFVVLPFHYVYGKSLLNTHVAVGGRVVVENAFLYVQDALDHLESSRSTGFAGVPSTFAILLNKSNLDRRTLPDLRYVTQAGGAMSQDLQRRLLAALPGKRVFVMYGATEASARLSYLHPDDLPGKMGSIGKAIPNVELSVRRDDGAECEADEIGELVARGSNIMAAYWNAPEETAEVLGPEGFRTGDLARRDEDGYFWIVGRKREMIKSGAHRISPKEIEDALSAHPDVHEVAVRGWADEMLGESIQAFVTLRPGVATIDPEATKAWCRERLAAHKVPHGISVLGEFPRNASGKIDKLSLRPAGEDRPGPSTRDQ